MLGLLELLDPALIDVSLDLLSDLRETFSEAGGLYDEHARLELERHDFIFYVTGEKRLSIARIE